VIERRPMQRKPMFIAVVVTCLAATLLLLYVRRFEANRTGGDLVSLLVVKRTLERGHALESDDLAAREVPQAYVESRAVRASERNRVLGLRLGAALETEQTLFWTDLEIASPERRELASLVTPGHRAVYMRAMREDQGSALIRPGDYVDVIVTLGDQPQTATDSKAAVVLLQKVLVLANGLYTSPTSMDAEKDDKTRTPLREQGLTVSLNVEEAELVSLASAFGQFSVALRGQGDPRASALVPDVTTSAMLEKKPRPKRAATSSLPVRLVEAPPFKPNR
jgi:pilus assembly protein CpaB